MHRRVFGRLVVAIVALGSGFVVRSARALGLSPSEQAALDRGESVRRPLDVELEQGSYIGGLAYSIVQVPAPFVLAMLHDVSIYKRVLALTLEAKPVGKKGADQLVYLKHGGNLGTAAYTMRIRPAGPDGVIRFWMDPEYDHEIEDIWGFIRVEPITSERCLVTYAVLCDLGTILRLLFGEKVRKFALDTADHIRWVAAEKHAEARAEPDAESLREAR